VRAGTVVVAGVVRHRRAKIRSVGRSEGEGQLWKSSRGTKHSRIKKTTRGRGWRWIISSSSVYRTNKDAVARLLPCQCLSVSARYLNCSSRREVVGEVTASALRRLALGGLGLWAVSCSGSCPSWIFLCPPRNQQEKLSNSRSPTRHQDREAAPYRGSS